MAEAAQREHLNIHSGPQKSGVIGKEMEESHTSKEKEMEEVTGKEEFHEQSQNSSEARKAEEKGPAAETSSSSRTQQVGLREIPSIPESAIRQLEQVQQVEERLANAPSLPQSGEDREAIPEGGY